ncbi:putative bifunctional diguanylate cyclase/phosphodiesterase [Alkanindiges sp. WGS2144]|uniref:putative bifunctional diguanylate cyclase/phosphodiesterase n=1 Tax=Alkanindiges sp. WGS2144 TaxID=3366808 RepID=UPI003751CA56
MWQEQWFEWIDQHQRQMRMVTLPLLIILLVGGNFLVSWSGGLKFGYVHALYIPVLLSGFVFGCRGGLLTGIIAGLIVGPWMPIDITTGELQNTVNWLFRLSAFTLIGFLGGLASDSTKAYQRQLRWLVRHDSSTRLPNRCALINSLAKTEVSAEPDRVELLVMICCDNETELKSAFGSVVVEQTVIQLAERFKKLCNDAKVYQTGPAQLSLLFGVEANRLETLLVELLESAREPVMYNKVNIHVDTRIGYSVLNPEDLPENSLRMAEAALTAAKQTSRDIVAYDPAITSATEENIQLLGQLKYALSTGQLMLHYQPKVEIATGRIYGVEALLRWNHPNYGSVPPGKFIPRAEQSTLIEVITEFVLEEAIKQLAVWQKAGINVCISVNISTRNLLQADFTDYVMHLLNQYDLCGELLELEITEGSLIMDVQRAIDELNRLTQLKVLISIDDFGTGYSSLQYLHQLPISILKIDQSFVRRLPEDQGAAYILEAAIALAHNLGIKAIAEGVENQDIYEFLDRAGCDMAQGYLISRPIKASDFESWYNDAQGTFQLPPNPGS